MIDDDIFGPDWFWVIKTYLPAVPCTLRQKKADIKMKNTVV